MINLKEKLNEISALKNEIAVKSTDNEKLKKEALELSKQENNNNNKSEPNNEVDKLYNNWLNSL